MNRKYIALVAVSATVGVSLLAACGSGDAAGADTTSGSSAASERTFVNVVKLAGGDWFNRMEVGNQEWATANGATVTQTAGDDSSPEKQIAVISDLLPTKPSAITVVPNSSESLEAVLTRAREAGIIVITHEAAGIASTDADIEAFDNLAYGAHQMDLLADCIGDGGGTYAHLVGSLTVQSHNEWAAGAAAQAASEYPDITSIGDPISSDENVDTAYQRTKELLARYPDLKGILGSASTDVAGAGRAIEEAGKSDSVCVIGTSLPSISGTLLETGAVDVITFWDPALAGQAMLSAASILLDGGVIEEGTDLGVDGYNSLVQSPDSDTTFFGTAWVDVTTANSADYPF